jgi:hypothetical protein
MIRPAVTQGGEVMKRWLVPCAAALALSAGAAERDDAWIAKEARRIRTSDTEAWRRVPWAGSLTDAAAAAKREGRPMFVFSQEGNLDTGRC